MKRTMTIMMLAVGASPLFACATTTPSELIEARASYRRAANGPAAQYARGQLSTAQRALERAEAEFLDDGNDRDTRDMAYIASRLSAAAEAQAQLTLAQNERTDAQRRLEIARAEQQRATEDALGAANQQL